jgi:NADPH:quinone reductase-like Zn-dependent oxidoreductase
MVAMADAPATPATKMRAVVRDAYGSADVLRIEEIPVPELTDDGVLVRVRAAGLNRADWYELVGQPLLARPMMGGVRKPRSRAVGGDFAGVVEAVGKGRDDFEPGDEVFGSRSGAFAEYVCARNAIVRKPPNVTFEEAAAVPVAALTALQALRDHGGLQPGQRVLVNGASGGVGTFAVQIAKALGAGQVTAVCSTRNVERALLLGADRAIDYTREDFTRSGERYDVLFDNAGSRSWHACTRVLTRDATVVLVGGPKRNRFLGPLGHIAAMRLASLPSKRTTRFFVAKFNPEDLEILRRLLDERKITPVIDRRYELSETAEAFGYMGEGHAQGKIVITI